MKPASSNHGLGTMVDPQYGTITFTIEELALLFEITPETKDTKSSKDKIRNAYRGMLAAIVATRNGDIKQLPTEDNLDNGILRARALRDNFRKDGFTRIN